MNTVNDNVTVCQVVYKLFALQGNVIGDHLNVAKEFFSSMEKSSILT